MSTASPNSQIAAHVAELSGAPYRSIPKILLDVILWVATAYAIQRSSHWIIIVALAFFVGAIPLHDLLIHGHEGSHRLISRIPWLNEFLGWLTLAPVFISATAHRIFHLRHHQTPHQEGDPEYDFFNQLVPGVPGWAFLVIPAAAPLAVNLYALRAASEKGTRLRIMMEMLAAIALHVGLAWFLGLALYLKAVVLPIFTGLPLVSFLRAISEHHATPHGDDWAVSRSVKTNRLLEFFWSNVNYHLEHHLYPGVPYHKLPALKRLLQPGYEEHHAQIGEGYLRTAATLVRVPNHFQDSASASGLP